LSELEKQQVNVKLLINSIITTENNNAQDVKLSVHHQCENIKTNEFAFTTVLTNLINNALYYSPDSTPIIIDIVPDLKTKKMRVKISNVSIFEYSEQDLVLFFEPLWQKDSSRTSEERYGLGLAIVKSYCEKMGATLNVSIEHDQKIVFTIII
jgi:signal transduction histidine kinase